MGKAQDHASVKVLCKDFIRVAKKDMPSLLQKPKIHLILHLSENLKEFGPVAVYNTERYT